MRGQTIKALVLASLALAVVGCAPQSAPPQVVSIPTITVPTATPAVAETVYEVQRGEVAEIVLMNGRVAAALDQDSFFTKEGYIKQLHVKRTDVVTSGQLLAEIDLGDLPNQLAQAQADLTTVQRMVASTRQQRSYSVESARLSLQNAQDRLARLQAPPSEAAIKDAQATIERARLNLDTTRNNTSAAKTAAQLAVDRAANNLRNRQDEYSQVMWQNGNKPLEELSGEERIRQEQAARAVEDAQTTLDQARVSYDLAVQNERNAVALAERDIVDAERELAELSVGPDPFDIREAENAVQAARVNLQQAQSMRDSPEMASRIENSRQIIAELQAQVEASKIYAPFDGVVAEVGVKPGDRVEAYAPIINIMDPSRLTLVVSEISSEDLVRIAPGQKLEIAFARYPDELVPGSVEQLPSDQTSAASGVRADRLLRIAFERGERQFDIGDTAAITIVFKREPNALWLPPQALYEFDARTFVLLKDGDEQREVDVTVGISTSERVQILSGLEEGDQVIVSEAITQ